MLGSKLCFCLVGWHIIKVRTVLANVRHCYLHADKGDRHSLSLNSNVRTPSIVAITHSHDCKLLLANGRSLPINNELLFTAAHHPPILAIVLGTAMVPNKLGVAWRRT